MCVPLIVQNKLSLAESFVTGHNHLEHRLVTLLDSWCHPCFSVEEIIKYGACVNILEPMFVGSVPRYELIGLCLHVFPQAVPSPLSVQTVHGPDSAQNAHQTSLPTHGEIQH